MSAADKATLSLPKSAAAEAEERAFELDLFDVLVPCRNFHLEYRYAEVGSVSLVTEFLLRLIHSAEHVTEADAAAFFGFDMREMRFALDSISADGYVSRSNGELTLTAAGRSLFRYDQASPQIYSLQSRQSTFGFDLISLAPQENPQLSDFERAFKELSISNMERVSQASSEIRNTFRKWFYELMSRSDKDSLKKASLYSIDEVRAGRRYSACVPVLLRGSTTRPSLPEVELTHWRSPQEIEDRGEIVEAISSYVEDLKVPVRTDDRLSYGILRDIASEFLSEFTRKDGTLSVERLFNETTKRAGELRADRPTVPIVGTIFTPSNAQRVRDALSYTKQRLAAEAAPRQVSWLIPSVAWGQGRGLLSILKDLKRENGEQDNKDEDVVRLATAISADRVPDHINKAFDRAVRPKDGTAVPPSLEILYLPGQVAAILVHCPIQAPRGIPVPIGILSFDELILHRVHSFLTSIVSESILLGE